MFRTILAVENDKKYIDISSSTEYKFPWVHRDHYKYKIFRKLIKLQGFEITQHQYAKIILGIKSILFPHAELRSLFF